LPDSPIKKSTPWGGRQETTMTIERTMKKSAKDS